MSRLKDAGINWVIIGACTGTGNDLAELQLKYPELTLIPYGNNKWVKKWTAQPKIEWVDEIVRAADKVGVPVFLKNNLDPLLGQNPAYKKWLRQDSEGHDLYGLRQEMPK